MRAFVLTIVFNEDFFLRHWVNYYSKQVGQENLFILDHGSSDLSTTGLGRANIIRVPRGSFSDVKKSTFASYMHGALLSYYDAGFVTDVDEMLVVSPRKYKDLAQFAETVEETHLAAIGLELMHDRLHESDYNPCVPILAQRKLVKFNSWMCKRSFSKKPLRLGGGFHTSDKPVVFSDDFHLIHIKNFDRTIRLARQNTTSDWDYAGDFGTHARRSKDYVESIFANVDSKVQAGKVRDDFSFSHEVNLCLERTVVNPSGEYDFNLNGGFESDHLYKLPESYENMF